MFNIFIKERYLSEARVDRLFWFKKAPGVSYKDIFKYFVIYQHPYRSVNKDAQPVPIVLYEEVGDYIGIPREWALEKIANYDTGLFKDNTTLGDSIYPENFVFEGSLYPEQKNACERVFVLSTCGMVLYFLPPRAAAKPLWEFISSQNLLVRH